METQNSNSTTKETPLRVESVGSNNYGGFQATLRQQVETISTYGSKNLSSLDDNLFSPEDFKEEVEAREYKNTQKRIAWMPVPQGTTKEAVEEKLKAFPNARIQRILSSEPITDSNQDAAIESDAYDLSLDQIAESQVVRPGADEKPVLFNGKVQYRRNVISLEGEADIDMRDSSEEYVPDSIREELEVEETSPFSEAVTS